MDQTCLTSTPHRCLLGWRSWTLCHIPQTVPELFFHSMVGRITLLKEVTAFRECWCHEWVYMVCNYVQSVKVASTWLKVFITLPQPFIGKGCTHAPGSSWDVKSNQATLFHFCMAQFWWSRSQSRWTRVSMATPTSLLPCSPTSLS